MAENGLSSLPFWVHLTEDEKESVKRGALSYHFDKGAMLGGCLGMVITVSGCIRTYTISEEGREITLFRLHPKDSCILSASCVLKEISFEIQMAAEEDTELLVIPSALFERLSQENIHVRCFAYERASTRLSAMLFVLSEIMFQKFDHRLASYLLEECEKTGKSEIRMTQEEIAREVNSAREVVARMLHQFAMDGCVELHRGTIVIKDKAALRAILQ